MSRALEEIQRRRRVLQARSRIERSRLTAQAADLLQPARIAGRASAAVRRLMLQPWWMLALAAACLVVRPRRLLAWAGPVLAAWRLWQGVKGAMGR